MKMKKKSTGNLKIQKDLERDILDWFQSVRAGKYTSYVMIANQWCLRRYMKEAVESLMASGKIIKLKSGYRVNKKTQIGG